MKGIVTGVALAILAAGPAQPPAVVFPPPPDAARIRWVQDIRDGAEFRPREGFWRRVLHAVAGAPERVEIVRPWGVEVAGDLLLVCDPGAGVVHGLRRAERKYVRFPRSGALASPIDAAVDGSGRVHVTDSASREVLCFDPDGRRLFRHEGPFERPTGITYDAATDRLYIVDTARHAIVVRTPGGADAGSFGRRGDAEGELNFPVAISGDGRGRLWVTDAMNFRVQAFAVDGTPLGHFGALGDGPGDFEKPKGVAVDSAGRVWVVESLSDSVRIFDGTGALLLAFGREGRGPGEFWLPAGIDVEGDRIYVADAYNGRVQVFELIPGGEG